MGFGSTLYRYRNFVVIWLTPIILLPLPFLTNDTEIALCGYMLLLMAVYWVYEAIPLGVTGMIPVFLAPMFGLLTTEQVCYNYLEQDTMMFTGGIMAAIAIEECFLHKRIAIRILMLTGIKPQWLMMGFVFPTWFLSMWISNTATTSMMMPIMEAVLKKVADIHFPELNQDKTDEGEEGTHGKSDGNTYEKIGHSADTQNGYSTTRFVNVAVIGEDEWMSDLEPKRKTNNFQVPEIVSVEQTERRPMDANKADDYKKFLLFAKGMTLCIPYASNIGGVATLTGTSTNIVMKGQADEIWQFNGYDESPVNFATWMIMGFPISVISIIILYAWFLLFYIGKGLYKKETGDDRAAGKKMTTYLDEEYEKLGPMSYAEWAVGTLFVILILLWFFRSPGFIPGWGNLPIFKDGYIGDAVASMLIVVLMFAVPYYLPWQGEGKARNIMPPLLTWQAIHEKYPWDIIFLMGGGYALAECCEVSGFSQWFGEVMTVFAVLPYRLMVFIICFLTMLLTNVTSNTATCAILMPIMAAMAEELGLNPLYLMFPVAITCSMAFLLPAGTPPNAIAFGYGRVAVMDMVKGGSVLAILCLFPVNLATHTWGYNFFDFGTIPWDNSTTGNDTALFNL